MSTEERDLPSYDELPKYKNFNGCAWEVWGKDDQLGTINLLTDSVVQRSAAEEIKTGKSITLNWPLNFPASPVFGRQPPDLTVISKHGEEAALRDDVIHMNTQSGSQWDGLRHFGVLEHGIFYQGIIASEIKLGQLAMPNPHTVDPERIKLGIHNWAQHGISGRGVLLDVLSYFTKQGTLPYNPLATSSISVPQLLEVAKAQGVSFRRGDILFLRVGFIDAYNRMSDEQRVALRGSQETFAGIEQSEDMKRFLWDNHFAAIASDQPAIESWPPAPGVKFMHETLLGLWGMPIGEFFDLEALSQHCEKVKRYTFFVSSWPLNILGGVASPPNAAAYF